jgi:hypothetical protein
VSRRHRLHGASSDASGSIHDDALAAAVRKLQAMYPRSQ